MNAQFLARLTCPTCRRPLEAEAARQQLSCPKCRLVAPVHDGIPRFSEDSHLANFALQWNRFDVARPDEDRATFAAKTGLVLESLAGKEVLDAGCGGGRYARIAGEAGAHVVAVDHTAAVDKAAIVCRHLPKIDFVQADLRRLPLPPESFDVVFSLGVLHHDADPHAAFDAVARMVRPGGTLAVWVYRRNQWWQEAVNGFLRRRTVGWDPVRLERWCRRLAALGGVPLLNRTLNKVIPFSSHPHPENRLCDDFDWYAPKHQSHHRAEEVREWFESAGFEDVRILPPERKGPFYRLAYRLNLLPGSGVNVVGTKRRPEPPPEAQVEKPQVATTGRAKFRKPAG